MVPASLVAATWSTETPPRISAPAFACRGAELNFTTISSLEEPHSDVLIFHRNVYDISEAPLKVARGSEGRLKLPEAGCTTLHEPDPDDGVFALRAIDVSPHVTPPTISLPAAAVVGNLLKVTLMSSDDAGHMPLEIDHRST